MVVGFEFGREVVWGWLIWEKEIVFPCRLVGVRCGVNCEEVVFSQFGLGVVWQVLSWRGVRRECGRAWRLSSGRLRP